MLKRHNENIGVYILIYLNFLFWLIPIYYLIQLQLVKAQDFKEKIDYYGINKTIKPLRGKIYVQDKNGNLYLVAETKKIYDVYFNPIKSKDPEQEINLVSKILKIDKDKINTKKQSSFIIAKEVEESVLNELLKLKLDSLFYEENLKRLYPEDNFLSTIIGFASYDENEGLLKGRYGIEKYYDEILKGEKGLYFGVNKIKTEIPGADIVLNIDYFLQKYSEKILQEAVKEYQAEGGLISIVTNDGKILALAEEPNYNLNKFFEIKNYHTFLTKFVQNYEPGSVIKTITFFAGLDNNVFKPSDKYFDSGYIKVDNWTIYNFDKKGRGEVTFEQAFEQSLNTGAMHIQKLLGNYRFLSYLKKFRFNLKPFIDFPNLNDGNIKNLEKSPRDLRDVNFLTASFGHGISISPVHLIQAFTVFANKGEMVKLNFVDRINFSDGSIEKNTKKIITKIGSEESINETKYLLEQVTLDGGGKKAKTEGYRIGGKTGSAYIPKINEPGYSDDVINTYIALFPLSNPKFIIFVRIDKPNQGLAMVTTVPVAKKVIDYLIDYYNIPPDDIQE